MFVDLKGKVALVTGGLGAIGSACVLDYVRCGAKVVVVDTYIPTDEGMQEEVEKLSGQVRILQGDVTSRDDMGRIAETVEKDFGRIDILVNNAGINVPKEKRRLVYEFFDDEWDKIISVDLNGVYNCSKPLIKMMVDKRYGKIINISSIVGIVPLRNQNAFAAAKAGVINLTKAWALELAQFGINVNAVAPGSILAEGTKQLFYDDQRLSEAMNAHIPIGRPGDPGDVSNAVMFLSSDESSYITGTVLPVDGGWTCGFARDF